MSEIASRFTEVFRELEEKYAHVFDIPEEQQVTLQVTNYGLPLLIVYGNERHDN